MILNITIKNYRSLKEETVFTMIAESSKSKESNVFLQPIAKDKERERLLKIALIYGANSSGKSNFLRFVYEIGVFICKVKPKVNESIKAYDPFRFDEKSKTAPTEFSLDFIGKNDIKYKYEISFTEKDVTYEKLTYWPENKAKVLFIRLQPEEESIIHKIKYGSKEIEIFHNQAGLSKFGEDIPHKIISDVYLYVSKIEVINACANRKISDLRNDMKGKIAKNTFLLKRMNELLRFADTGINGISINELEEKEFEFPQDFPEDIKNKVISENKYLLLGQHNMFHNQKLIGDAVIPFDEESQGVRTMLALGGKMLEVLENGGTLFVDEIETSFHPYLSKLLITLFQSERINSKNAQLIFATHDITLLDRTLFRKDQIWFAEKDEFGVTDFYPLQSFTDVREDTPFDKWYMAGKFGGIPNIKSLEALFLN